MIDWKNTTIAPDGSHHLYRGAPFYEDRFDSVMKYHEPGLAPVYACDESWHIDVGGRAAYKARYRKVFGFYDGLAVFDDRKGWAHLLPDGTAAYDMRYDWCGNFQNGLCAVRLDNGLYRHIHKNGKPAYENLWKYTGDFRDGIAVVQREDGLSSHIDSEGKLLHSRWLRDLDVFHKGYARAKDQEGWVHVDVEGNSVYSQRYQMIEPFYNGQARVERHDGGIEIIDVKGARLIELRPAIQSAFSALSADMVGFWKTETIAAAVKLNIIEALPGPLETIAAACGIPSRKLNRLLNALGEMGIARKNWLVVLEMMISKSGYNGSLCDLHLLVESGGTQRTREQFRRLLEKVGFNPSFILENHAPAIIIGNPK